MHIFLMLRHLVNLVVTVILIVETLFIILCVVNPERPRYIVMSGLRVLKYFVKYTQGIHKRIVRF
jgi:hypothetical protein